GRCRAASARVRWRPNVPSGGFLPVEVPAAALAQQQRPGRLQLLDGLRPDRHTAAAADGGAVDAGDGHAGARLQDLRVVGQKRAGELARARVAVGADGGQLRLDRLELLSYDGLVLAGLLLARLQARLSLADVGGDALLELHQAEDLLLAMRLLLLDGLDLGKDRRVLGVVLDLPQTRLGLGALGGDDVEVLLLGPELLPSRVGFQLERVQRLLGFGEGGVDGFDLLGKAGGFGFERGEPRIEAL